MIQRAPDAPGRARRPPPMPWPWLALFGAAALVRTLAALLGLETHPADPQLEVAARHLAAGHGLAFGPASTPVPTAALPPVTPALLAAALRAAHGHPLALPGLAIVLGAAGALAAARLATGLHGRTAGRAAGWAVALSPLLAIGGTAIEPPAFALLLLLALTASAEWLRTPRRVRAVAAGVLWGVCALAGPVGLLLPPMVMAWAWRPLGLTLPPRERLIQTGLLVLGLAGAVMPWTIRNAIVLRAPVVVTTSTGVELLSRNNPIVWSVPRRGGTIDVLRVEPYASRLAGLNEPQRDSRAREQALAFLAGRTPRELAAVAAARLAQLWSLGPGHDDRGAAGRPAAGAAVRVLAGAEALWLLLAAWGTLRTLSGPRRWFQSLPLAALLVLVAEAIAVSGSWGARLGFEPLVAMLAGVGALHARRSLHLRRRGLRVVTGRAGAGRGP